MQHFSGLPPSKLPGYLLDFASSETATKRNRSVILLCKGVGEQSHLFLARTSWKRCHGCNGVLCGFCSSEIEDRPYCLQCFAVESLVPSTDGGYMDRISTMRMELKHKYRFDGADELPLHDVEQIYDCAIQSFGQHDELKNHVKYPLYPTSHLRNAPRWKDLYEIRFSSGGTFITDPTLGEHVPAILNLFASFVTYEKKKHTDWLKDASVYDALPTMIIDFAKNSRIDSGYRLLERCVRHGHDPKIQSLFNNTAKIIQVEDGSLGIVISHKVPASMRADTYNTTIAHTADDILAVECNCKAVSKDND